jgi:hypothetical protein
MSKKEFILACNGDISDGHVIGIVHSNWSEVIPYFLKCDTGAVITNVRSTALRLNAEKAGDSIAFKLYAIPAHHTTEFITRDYIERLGIQPFCKLEYVAPCQLVVSYAPLSSDINFILDESKYIVGLTETHSSGSCEDIYIWVTYDDSPVI